VIKEGNKRQNFLLLLLDLAMVNGNLLRFYIRIVFVEKGIVALSQIYFRCRNKEGKGDCEKQERM